MIGLNSVYVVTIIVIINFVTEIFELLYWRKDIILKAINFGVTFVQIIIIAIIIVNI